MSRITPGSSIESFRKEAKRWLKSLRANDADARARLARAVPDAPAAPTLRDVQHALAIEHGFTGWTALRDFLAGSTATVTTTAQNIDWVARFFDVACPDHHVRGGPDHSVLDTPRCGSSSISRTSRPTASTRRSSPVISLRFSECSHGIPRQRD